MKESPLKELRLSLGLTQSEFAGLSSVSQGHISQAELGNVTLSARLLNFLAALHVDADDFALRHNEFMRSIRQKRNDRLKDYIATN